MERNATKATRTSAHEPNALERWSSDIKRNTRVRTMAIMLCCVARACGIQHRTGNDELYLIKVAMRSR